MAAGLSLKSENVDAFRRDMNERCGLLKEDLIPEVVIDVPVPISYLTIDRIRELSVLEPFGNGNEKPVFADKNVMVKSMTYIGKEKQYLKFSFGDVSGLYFGDGQKLMDGLNETYGSEAVKKAFSGVDSGIKLSFTYYPQINTYRGNESMQVVIEEWRI